MSGVIELKKGAYTEGMRRFWADFLASTTDVEDPTKLPGFSNRASFRQLGTGDEAVLVDMTVADRHRFMLRDFKSVTMGQGHGGQALAHITSLADKWGARIDLRAVAESKPEGSKLVPVIPQDKLISFYEGHRWFLQPQDTRESIGPIMFRPPQSSQHYRR